MTDLSPAAQAVLDAYRSIWLDEPMDTDVECLAAALRAAADQVVPPEQETPWGSIVQPHQAELRIRADLLAISAELEGAE